MHVSKHVQNNSESKSTIPNPVSHHKTFSYLMMCTPKYYIYREEMSNVDISDLPNAYLTPLNFKVRIRY